jgi:hypothetical protein
MIDQLKQEVFSEVIYAIRHNLLILISEPWERLPEPEKLLLAKIVEAIRYSLPEVTILSGEQTTFQELSIFNPRYIISFGVPVAGVTERYVLSTHGQTQLVLADSLGKMNQAEKEKLWAVIKNNFQRIP